MGAAEGLEGAMPELQQFFAVTVSQSVYEACAARNKDGVPLVTKIAGTGRSKVGVGERLGGGNAVGITSQLQMYLAARQGEDQPPRPVDEMKSTLFGGHTACLVALFLNREEALQAAQEPDLRPWDKRWEFKSLEVVLAIGSQHPTFSIAASVFNRFAEVAARRDRAKALEPPDNRPLHWRERTY